jgi:hypothetical protein
MEYVLVENLMAVPLNKEFNSSFNPKFLHPVYGKGPLNPIQSSDLIFPQYILAPFEPKFAESHHLFPLHLFASFHLFACKDSNLSRRLPSR